MKHRSGFVSNSSSSSYTCDVCGGDISGWDINISEYGWIHCTSEHCLCGSCKLKDDSGEPFQKDGESNEDFDERYEKWMDETEEGYYSSEECCPICQMTTLINSDAAAYLMKVHNTNYDKVKEEIKARFKNYDELQEFIK